MHRIGLAIAGLLLAATGYAEPAWMPAHGETLAFQLLDDKDREIGSLRFEFEHSGEGLRVTRRQTIRTRKFLMKVHIDQTTTSLWRDGRLVSVVSDTVADTSLKDKTLHLEVAPREGGALEAIVNGERHELPADTWPMTLWHVGFMAREQLFGTGSGELLAIAVSPGDSETLETAAGPRDCRRYEIKADLDGKTFDNTLWYAPDGRLCAMLMNTGLGPQRYWPVAP